jgi:hypothetical protein
VYVPLHHFRDIIFLLAKQFDKDDLLAVEFVTAAANLRAACFGISKQSLFDTKVCRLD